MTVVDLSRRRALGLVGHPSLPSIDQAGALVQLARVWDEIVGVLSVGPGCLSEVEAEEATQLMASALVHPLARPGLVFSMPQLKALVKQSDDLRDGNLDPVELGQERTEDAMHIVAQQIDLALYPLITGLPITDACRTCVNTVGDVSAWQPWRSCTQHKAVTS